MLPKDQDKFVFYVNNYIDWDQFNQLYDLNWMKKGIKNVDAVARKLGPALTRAINDRLEAAKEERQKREEMIEKGKTKAMTAKWRRARGGISLSNKEEDKSDTKDNIDLDQSNDKYPLQL